MGKCDFTADLPSFTQLLNGGQFVGQGGDDLPEDVLGGLDEACRLTWSSRARFVVWVGDAPAHGMHEGKLNDNHSRHPRQLTAQSVLGTLTKKDIELVAVQVMPSYTQYMIKQMQKIWKPLHDDTAFEVTDLGQQMSNNQYHFVFVLDESGSMCGTPWSDLLASYERFRQLRCGDQSNDIISVVTFDSSARTRITGKPSSQAIYRQDPNSGGTSFNPALMEAFGVLNRFTGYTPVMVFMSDGDCGERPDDVCQRLREGASRFNQFRFFAVAFRNSTCGTLQQMVQTMNRSGVRAESLHSNDRMSLQKNFEKVAETSKVTEILQDVVGAKIADAVGYRIFLDHL